MPLTLRQSSLFSLLLALILAIISHIRRTRRLLQQDVLAKLLHDAVTQTRFPKLCEAPLQGMPQEKMVPGRWLRPAKTLPVQQSRITMKHWCYIAINTPTHLVAAAIVQFAYLSDTFLYVVDKKTRKRMEFTGRKPAMIMDGARFAESSVQGRTTWNGGGGAENSGHGFEMTAAPDGLFHLKGNVNVKDHTSSSHKLAFDFVMDQSPKQDALVLAYPLAGDENRLMYVHKGAGQEVVKDKSLMRLDGQQVDLSHAVGGIDWTAGCALHVTRWRWASFHCASAKAISRTSRQEKQVRVGLNLSEMVYDLALNNGKIFSTENGVFVDGKLYATGFGSVSITVPRTRPDANEWTIASVGNDESIRLTFSPWGMRSDHTNLGVIVSDFVQPYGVFRGTIMVDEWTIHFTGEEAFGVVENHAAVW